jgi:hypothetical protein
MSLCPDELAIDNEAKSKKIYTRGMQAARGIQLFWNE